MTMQNEEKPRVRKPPWLRRKLPSGPVYEQVKSLIRDGELHTVCQEAKCPNQWECFSCRTATFLIMGPRCTRNCRFCAVEHGPLGLPDPEEPARVAEAAGRLGLRYVVVTSVTRDDLPDGGAGFFAATIRAIRERVPDALVEVLVPDFQGDADALRKVVAARPDVLNHNLETVPRLYPSVRPGAVYRRSLGLLSGTKKVDPSLPTKSGLMLGLGESSEEVRETHARSPGCGLQPAHPGPIPPAVRPASSGGALRHSGGIRGLENNCARNGLFSGRKRPLRAEFLPRERPLRHRPAR